MRATFSYDVESVRAKLTAVKDATWHAALRQAKVKMESAPRAYLVRFRQHGVLTLKSCECVGLSKSSTETADACPHAIPQLQFGNCRAHARIRARSRVASLTPCVVSGFFSRGCNGKIAKPRLSSFSHCDGIADTSSVVASRGLIAALPAPGSCYAE